MTVLMARRFKCILIRGLENTIGMSLVTGLKTFLDNLKCCSLIVSEAVIMFAIKAVTVHDAMHS